MLHYPEIEYTPGPDGMLDPVLYYPKQPAGTIGKYGHMRLTFLQNHRKSTYAEMRLTGVLKQHLLDIDTQAWEMLDTIIDQMKTAEGVTEELKAKDPMEWIRRMNGIKTRAEEVVREELIYR